MATTDSGVGDGQYSFSELEATQIIPEEYFENRQGDLAGTAIVRQKYHTRPSRKLLTPLPSLARRIF